MRDRQGKISILAITSVWLILSARITDVRTTACTDKTDQHSFSPVIKMCSSRTVRDTRAVIDSWDTGSSDVYSCTCTVILDTKSMPSTAMTEVTAQEYPGIEPFSSCGSKLRITSTTFSSFSDSICTAISSTAAENFRTADMLTLTLSRTDSNTPWQSGHCILISQVASSFHLIVNCTKYQKTPNKASTASSGTRTTTTTSTKTSTKTSTTISTTRSTTTTIKPPSTSARLIPTQSPTKNTTVNLNGNTTAMPTTAGKQAGSNAVQSDVDVGIIAGAAGGGGLLVVVAIIVIVVIIRRKRSDTSQPVHHRNKSNGNTNEGLADDIQSHVITGTIKKYVNSDGDTITHNSLYESAGPRDPGDNHIVTETGDIYSQVQKPHKYCTINDIENETLELEETRNGDLYTVVNKSKTPNINNETDENRPSRYKTADGLMYAEVSVQEGTSRTQSRVKSQPPPVSPKPKTDSGNVVYAEVNTGI